jgi:D-arabinan exo alpha-(1,3)/(1,5)-arabinofuranosidase (non-reducing end)
MASGESFGLSPLRGLALPRHHRSRRASSWDRTGANLDRRALPAGGTLALAEIDGPGCIVHIWMTIGTTDLLFPRKLVLRMYWDGQEHPSVEAPLGDFFGVGHGTLSHYVSLPFNIVSQIDPLRRRHRAALNCFLPMPFSRGARITLTNDADQDVEAVYWYVDYEEYAPEHAPDEALRFHAQWRCERPTAPPTDYAAWNLADEQLAELRSTSYSRFGDEVIRNFAYPNPDGSENYVTLEAEGRGHYVGCNLSVDNVDPIPGFGWFGEGDDMTFVDGEPFPPSLHGTGTEDYFCAAYCYPTGKYDGPYHGVSLAGDTETWQGKWTTYRFHVEDPIAFEQSIRVTIEHGHGNTQANDYSSTAYWYQTLPNRPFPPLPPATQRLPLSDEESRRRFYSRL